MLAPQTQVSLGSRYAHCFQMRCCAGWAGAQCSPCQYLQHFATGYHLGEVLNKLNLQPDFDYFEDRRTPDAMLKNFARLQVGTLSC